MVDISSTAKSYLDFAGLGQLKAQAKKDQIGTAREVGRQFEAMFIEMIFKSVRQANLPIKSKLISSSSLDTVEQMYHEELSQVLAQRGALGVGDWLAKQIQAQTVNRHEVEADRQEAAKAYAIPVDKTVKGLAIPQYETGVKGGNNG